ncbi:hypothetical protein GCM10009801_36550 [Streptomyces albiaxialis]|uniref:Translation initiation factor 2 n=1 Tax=Streptomyces albiaxialis TaxID=329523 RepID=A0ABN2W0J1_9ACTN
MTTAERPARIRVPVGDDAARWATRGRCHRVLLVVHNVTSASRLLDVLPLFHDDFRVQLLLTSTGSSAFQSGIGELFAETGLPVIPWEQALTTRFDLVVSASFGGRLGEFSGELAVLSHGIGYTKRLATPDTGHRTPDTRHQTQAPVFGLSPEWLLVDGKPLADALVLSHPEQAERLRRACPEAGDTAVLAGDPCFDRMLAARPYRERFRRALGVRRGQRLVVLNSTWNPESLFGDGGGEDLLPSLLPRLTAELPADAYRLVAVLHPNIWHGHGPGQIRAWLDRARRGGLTLIDPLRGWRQALVAADLVIGDHGAVTYYAAALGTPVLLGAAPVEGLDPGSPAADFVRSAPRLDPALPPLPQVEAALAGHVAASGPREFTTSVPGEAAARLRRLFYGMMRLPEPSSRALLEPLPLPPYEPPSRTAPLRVVTRVRDGEVAIERYAEPGLEPGAVSAGGGAAHTAVHEDTRDQGALGLADVLFREGAADDPRLGGPARWTAEVLARHPHCALAAYATGPGTCVARPRSGPLLRLATEGPGADLDPSAAASALHAWLSAYDDGGAKLLVRTGATLHSVAVTPVEG